MRSAAIIFLTKGEDVLLLRASYPNGNTFWQGISGYVEPNEAPSQAAVREAKEELNITIDPDHLLQKHGLTVGDTNFTVFTTDTWLGEFKIQEVGIDELRWFPIDKLPLDQMHSGDKDWLPEALAE